MKKYVEALCEKAINDNPNCVADYKSGKKESINFLIGRVMRENKTIDFKEAEESLKEVLK